MNWTLSQSNLVKINAIKKIVWHRFFGLPKDIFNAFWGAWLWTLKVDHVNPWKFLADLIARPMSLKVWGNYLDCKRLWSSRISNEKNWNLIHDADKSSENIFLYSLVNHYLTFLWNLVLKTIYQSFLFFQKYSLAVIFFPVHIFFNYFHYGETNVLLRKAQAVTEQ